MLIAANSQPIWQRLVALMQKPYLLTDPRFETIQVRGKPENMRAIDAIIADWSRGFETVALVQMLQQAQVPATQVYTIADIFQDPHFRARQMLQQVPHPQLDYTVQTGIVPRLSATPGAIVRTGPTLGQDTEAVLQELGRPPA